MAQFGDPKIDLTIRTTDGDTSKSKTITYVNGGNSIGQIDESGAADMYLEFGSDVASLTGYQFSTVLQVSSREVTS